MKLVGLVGQAVGEQNGIPTLERAIDGLQRAFVFFNVVGSHESLNERIVCYGQESCSGIWRLCHHGSAMSIEQRVTALGVRYGHDAVAFELHIGQGIEIPRQESNQPQAPHP